MSRPITLLGKASAVAKLIAELARWTVLIPAYALAPSLRPDPAVKAPAAILILVLRTFASFICRLHIYSAVAEPDAPEHLIAQSTLKRSKMVIIPPFRPEFNAIALSANPVVAEAAERAQIQPVNIRAYWYAKDGTATSSINTGGCVSGQRVILCLHGGGWVVGTAHESGSAMATSTLLAEVCEPKHAESANVLREALRSVTRIWNPRPGS